MTVTSSTLVLTSDDFTDGGTLAETFVFDAMGCTGGNRSPHVRWRGVPTQSLALALHDPDAPTTVGFTHWILFDIDPQTSELPRGAGAPRSHPRGSVHGLNDFGDTHYDGPCPPPGDSPHRYQFTLYALDLPKLEGAGSNLTYPRFRFMVRGHVLAHAAVTGRYGILRP